MRRLAASIAVLALVLATGLAMSTQAQGPNRAYLPLVGNPPPTATPTATVAASPTVTTTPTIAPTPEPFFGDCFVDPDPRRAPNYPVQIWAIFDTGETVYHKNLSADTISLVGWSLCSIDGNEEYPLGSPTIAPNGLISITRAIDVFDPGDDATLYDPSGRLIAYYVD